jgi:hypothetical protein
MLRSGSPEGATTHRVNQFNQESRARIAAGAGAGNYERPCYNIIMKYTPAENLRTLLVLKPTKQKNIKGVPQPNVSAIKHGRRLPTRTEALALARHFGADVGLFLADGPILIRTRSVRSRIRAAPQKKNL